MEVAKQLKLDRMRFCLGPRLWDAMGFWFHTSLWPLTLHRNHALLQSLRISPTRCKPTFSSPASPLLILVCPHALSWSQHNHPFNCHIPPPHPKHHSDPEASANTSIGAGSTEPPEGNHYNNITTIKANLPSDWKWRRGQNNGNTSTPVIVNDLIMGMTMKSNNIVGEDRQWSLVRRLAAFAYSGDCYCN